MTDHTFRDALFNNFKKTLAKFGITDRDAIDRLSRLVNGGESVRHMLSQLERFICGGDLENCEAMRRIPKAPGPAPYAKRATAAKKKTAKKKK